MMFSALLLSSCNSKAEIKSDRQISPDSNIVKIVGDTVADVLFSPKSVSLYFSKNRKKKDGKEVEIAPGFVRDTLAAKLSPADIAVLQFVLLSDTLNYRKNKEQIKSPYMPLYEFVFAKKKETVQVLISFSDNYWEIKRNNKTVCKYNFANYNQLSRFIDLVYHP
jgi:hypothetical protein